MSRHAVVLLLLSLVLAACSSLAPQDEPSGLKPGTGPAVTEGIDIYMQQRLRVESVGFRLRQAAATRCGASGSTRKDLGAVVWSLANFPNPVDRTRLERLYNLTEAVTVALAIEGGPARKAGLRPGTIITHVDGIELPVGPGATARFIALSNEAASRGNVSLRLSDGAERLIQPELVCSSPVLLVRSEDMNAATDGKAVAMTTGLYGLLRSDDEIAVVLGHELAHILLGHTRSGSAADPSRETDADRAGLELAARAGYDIAAAPALWSRLNNTRIAPGLATTHPTGPAREAAIRKAVQEIRGARP
jgi:Zn-dependent protease with chaperone function